MLPCSRQRGRLIGVAMTNDGGRMSDRSKSVVGWFACRGMHAVCDGDACVIAGSDKAMRVLVSRAAGGDASAFTVKKTSFGEIMAGLKLGGAYCFDEEAYSRFFPLAQAEGLGLGREDFSDPGPTGVHLVRVQWQPSRTAGLLQRLTQRLSRVVRQSSSLS